MTALSARHHPDCYPSDPARCLAFFRDTLASYPADKLPPAPNRSSLAGIVTPHIDFRVSLAGWDDLTDFHRLSRALGGLIEKIPFGEKWRVIVSVDGCHLGPRFQHPFRVTPTLLQATAGWEETLWKFAARGNAREFLDWFRDEGNDRYFDGVGALALLMAGAAQGGELTIQRTYYEQWFTERDASAVTFSSGRVLGKLP